MATPKVLLKRSSVVGNAPSASDLEYGELAINFADGKIYFKDNSNAIKAFVDSARVEAIAASVGGSIDSAGVIALIDAAYVQARQDKAYSSLTGAPTNVSVFTNDAGYITTAENMLDSAEAIALIDSAHVQLRQTPQNFAYAALTGAPTLISLFTNDANYLDSNTVTGVIDAAYIQANQTTYDFLDSAEAIALIDSAHVQLRQTPQDFAYSSLTGAPTTVSTFTNDANYLDSNTVTGVIDAAYVQANQIQYNTSDFVDSAYVEANSLDSERTISLIDSAYIQLRDTPQDFAYGSLTGTPTIPTFGTDFVDSAYIEANSLDSERTTNLIDSSYVQLRAAFDTKFTAKSTSDLSEGSNLYYTKARADSDIASSLSDSTNTVNITINNTILDTVDSAYVLARINEAPFLDSADAIQLIDSAYIQARQVDLQRDSGFVTNIIDSAYIQLRDTPQDFAYASLTGAPTIPVSGTDFADSAWITLQINNLIDGAPGTLNTLNEIAAALNDDDSAYNTLIGLIAAKTDFDSAAAIALIDSDYIELRRPAESIFNVTSSGSSAYTFNGDGFSSSTNNPTLYLTRGKTYKFAMAASGHPFQIRVSNGGSAYNAGVTNNGLQTGNILFTPDMNAPTSLVYQCTIHSGMVGNIVILDDTDAIGLDSALASQLIDSAYIQLRDTPQDFAYGSLTGTPTIPVTGTDFADSAWILGQIPKVGVDYVDSAYVASVLPKTGVDFADSSWIVANFLDSALTVQLIDSAYIQDRQAGGGGGTVDSAYVESVSLDSERTQLLIDSAYIQLRQTSGGGTFNLAGNTGTHTFNTTTETLTFLGTTGQINAGIASNNVTLALDQNINSITSIAFEGDSANAHETKVQAVNPTKDNTISLPDSSGTIALLTDITTGGGGGTTDSATVLALIDSAHVQARQSIEAASPLILTNLIYTADSGQVSFTGADDNGTTLAVDSGKLQVFLNGILLSDADFSHNASKVDLTVAADSADILTVVKIGGNSGVSGFQQKHFIYNADSGQTVFTGAATSGEVLAYSNFNRTNVYLNGIMLISGTDYTAINGTTVTLVDAADSGDILDINTFIGSNIGLDSADVTNLIDSAYVTARAGAGTDSAAVIQLIDSAYVVARAGASTDSATVLNLIDSAHVALKAIGLDYGILANRPTIPVTGTDFADSAWITAQIDALIDGAPGTLNTLNEIAAALNDDDSAYGTLLTLINAKSDVDSVGSLSNVTYGVPTAGQILKYDAGTSKFILATDAGGLDSSLTSQLVDSAYVQARGTGSAPFELTNFIYTADSGQVTFTGADTNSRTLAIDSGKLQVFLNGILLSDADFSHNATKVDLTIAADSADILTIVKMDGNNTTSNFQSKHFIYNADSGQTAFTGAATSGEVLAYSNADRTNVYLNGIMLINGTDFTATNGSTLTLIEAADSGDVLDINVFKGSNVSLDSASAINLIDSAYVVARAGSGTDSAGIQAIIDSNFLQVSSHLIPNIDSAYNLGSPTKKWKDLYLSGNTIYLGGHRITGNPSGIQIIDSLGIEISLTANNILDSSNVINIIGSEVLDSALIVNLVDSAYIQLRDRFQDSSGILAIVDSAYVQARQTTSGNQITEIDSAGELTTLIDSASLGDIAFKLNPFAGYVLAGAGTGSSYVSSGFRVVTQNGPNITRLSIEILPSGKVPSDVFTVGQSIDRGAAVGDYKTITAISDTGGDYSKGYLDITPSTSGYAPPWNGQYVYTQPNAWQTFGIDSGTVTSIIDSAYVQLRQSGSGSGTVDSAYVTSQINNLIDGAPGTLNTLNEIASALNDDDSAYSTLVNLINAKSDLDSAAAINLIDSAYVRLHTRIGDSDIDFGANKIKYANVYTAEADLPSASTYHGMFAHVHATGAGYFAHGGNWIRLANKTETLDSALTTQLIDSAYVQLRQVDLQRDSAFITNIIDSSYVQLRQSAGGGGSGTVDSAYVEANSLDSERTTNLIDSDYILSRVTNTQPGEFNNDRTEFTVGGSDSGRRVFDTNNTLSLVSGNTDVFLNGILQVSGTDYTVDSSAVTFTSGVAANHQVTVLERSGKVITQRGLVENVFAFTTAVPATSITGTDDKGATLDVSEGYADVFLNGILLRDSDDYTINGAGTTLTLVSATDSADIVTIKNSKGVIVTPQVKRFEYTTATPLTTISGNDLSGNALAYVPGSLQVHLNGILLQEASDFTASTGNSIVLTTATDSADDVSVSAFSAPGSKLELYKFTADSGQTVFSGNDTANRFMSYEPGNIQVFLNGLLLNDSDDYTASNTKAIRLLTAATLNDELKVASFETTSEITRSNTWTAPSGTVSAAAGDKLFIDTSGGARIVTLPSSATMGDEIRIIDVTGNAGTNNITVSRNGHNIQGAASDLVINIARAGTGLAYYNATQGWVLIEN